MTDRRDLLRLAGFLVALLVVTGAILLATGGGSSDSPKGPSDGDGQVDGVLVAAEPAKLVLRPADGSPDMTFEVRATEAPTLDVPHLAQEHVPQQLPVRIAYIREDGKLYALRADDAPLPNG